MQWRWPGQWTTGSHRGRCFRMADCACGSPRVWQSRLVKGRWRVCNVELPALGVIGCPGRAAEVWQFEQALGVPIAATDRAGARGCCGRGVHPHPCTWWWACGRPRIGPGGAVAWWWWAAASYRGAAWQPEQVWLPGARRHQAARGGRCRSLLARHAALLEGCIVWQTSARIWPSPQNSQLPTAEGTWVSRKGLPVHVGVADLGTVGVAAGA